MVFAPNTSYLTTRIYDKVHHNIIYGKLYFDLPLPPPYYRKIWDYKKTNPEVIQKGISAFNWDMVFQNKDTNEKIKILNETLLNIFNNFISNKISSFDYKNAVWMNKRLHCF